MLSHVVAWCVALLPPATAVHGGKRPPQDLHEGLKQSQAKCAHGHNGGVIVLLHEATTPAAYRTSLLERMHPDHARASRFRHTDWTHIRAISLASVHPTTLHEVVFEHEHTARVLADCHVRAQLPQPIKDDELAGFVSARYHDTTAVSCMRNISVHEPGKRISQATFYATWPSEKNAKDCDLQTDLYTEIVGTVEVTGKKEAMIRIPESIFSAPAVRSRTVRAAGNNSSKGGQKRASEQLVFPAALGKYVDDPMGGLQDLITFADGSGWEKLPGPAYEKNSPIGPHHSKDGKRTRNANAWLRWNWGLERIVSGSSVELHDEYDGGGLNGNGTTLYVLDCGTQITHDDFTGRAVRGWSAGCPTGEEEGCTTTWVRDGVVDDEVMTRPMSNNQEGCSPHGTHTASTAAGHSYGVASSARVVPVQVLDCNGVGDMSSVMAGLDWATRHSTRAPARRPSVATLSLGESGRDEALTEAVATARRFGMTVIISAGNDNEDACGGSPASAPNAITVGATSLAVPMYLGGAAEKNAARTTVDMKAGYSNWGPCVNIWAPGTEILAAVPSLNSTHYTGILSGTSMSSPFVAGVALQLLSAFPKLTPDEVSRALQCLAEPDLVHGLDSSSRNVLLQGGTRIMTPAMRKLIAQQIDLTDAQKAVLVPDPRESSRCYYGSTGAAGARVAVRRAPSANPNSLQPRGNEFAGPLQPAAEM